MSDDIPDPQRIMKLARQTLSSAERRRKYRRIDFMDQNFWYPSQLAFFAAGSSGVHQRLLYAGNQAGKTIACAAETAWHLTGQYPDWWTGKRFNKPIRAWVVGESVVLVRDTLQRHLCGGQEFGTGVIPGDRFAKKPIMTPGGQQSIDTAFVIHETDGKVDGTSSVTFKTYEMQRRRLQSETVDWIWSDEKPDETVYSELLARTFASDGHLALSYTPIDDKGQGSSELTYRFLTQISPDRATFRIPGSEVKHISDERRETLSNETPESERETRMEGTPQLGAGPVFPIELLSDIAKPFNEDVLPSYVRRIVGIDFGFAAGFGAVYIAWAHDTGNVWVLDSFQMTQSSAMYHVQRIHSMTQGLRVPTSWPHDGHQADKGSGLPLAKQYKTFGANMLPSHALNYGTTNYTVEPGLEEIRDLMYSGKLAIAPHNQELIDQIRHYHRDANHKVVKVRDHLIDAFRYAIMMKRSGKAREHCDGVGFGHASMRYAGQQANRGGGGQIAIARDMDWNPFDPYKG
jgi:phage terminase large subunit-like protein